MVRAKFKVTSVTPDESGSGRVILHPVYSGSKENETFWKYTPAGYIDLTITNPGAINQFEIDKEYYVDFSLSE
jgi:hypothetical protein